MLLGFLKFQELARQPCFCC